MTRKIHNVCAGIADECDDLKEGEYHRKRRNKASFLDFLTKIGARTVRGRSDL